MNTHELALLRVANHRLADRSFASALDIVSWMGALQGQDYAASLAAVCARSFHLLKADVEDSLRNGEVVRTWTMRGTLHLVPARDVAWMTRLLARRSVNAALARYRQLGLDYKDLERGRRLFEEALMGGRQLTRPELYAAMVEAGLRPGGQRGIHLIGYAAQTGLICGTGTIGKQPAFALIDHWVPDAVHLSDEEGLGEIAWRYIRSHGPVTVHDFAWWIGGTVAQAKLGFAMNESKIGTINVDSIAYVRPRSENVADAAVDGTYLLPPFDEILLGYRDRTAILGGVELERVVPGRNGIFRPIILHNGRICGTWRRPAKPADGPEFTFFGNESEPSRSALERAWDVVRQRG